MEALDKQVDKHLTLDENANLVATHLLWSSSTAPFHILCILWEASEDNGGTSGGES